MVRIGETHCQSRCNVNDAAADGQCRDLNPLFYSLFDLVPSLHIRKLQFDVLNEAVNTIPRYWHN